MTTPTLSLSRTDPNLAAVDVLSAKLDKANIEYDRLDRYYSGDQPLAFMSPEVEAQIGGRLTPLVINWPETIVDSVARRLNPEGFRLGQGATADDELWRIFTANDLDEESPLGLVDMLVHGVTYLSVWGNDDDPLTPRMTFESAHQVTVDYEPGGRAVRSALKRWQDGATSYATYYTRDEVIRYAARTTALGVRPRYEIDQVLANPLRAVPIVPMVNKGRLLNRSGRSELASIAPIADGINKLATDLLVTAEFYTTPRRWATGMQMPSGSGDMARLQAEVKAYWDEASKEKTW
ncbi:phage portal protein, partial [Nocardioides sp.]|uniref:phage portal protein n=1 Tax=Nocardioides sp. TaxID=35761 RepID=UPI002C947AA0